MTNQNYTDEGNFSHAYLNVFACLPLSDFLFIWSFCACLFYLIYGLTKYYAFVLPLPSKLTINQQNEKIWLVCWIRWRFSKSSPNERKLSWRGHYCWLFKCVFISWVHISYFYFVYNYSMNNSKGMCVLKGVPCA